MKIHYQCSNCGKRFVTGSMVGIPNGMYASGDRAVGDAFYCSECVKTWPERNGEEFDKMYVNPAAMFVNWWNNTLRKQVPDKSKIQTYRTLANGDYVEVPK